jgi:hypothetical protein
VINSILEVEDVEDVACTVDDMEATDPSRSRSLVQRGKGGKGYKGRNDGGSVQAAKGCKGLETSCDRKNFASLRVKCPDKQIQSGCSKKKLIAVYLSHLPVISYKNFVLRKNI